MTNNRNKKALNSKQLRRISLIVDAIVIIGIFVTGIILSPTLVNDVYFWCLIVIAPIIFYFFLDCFIFKATDKEMAEIKEKAEFTIIQQLSSMDFKQVYFLAKDYGNDDISMMRQILKKEGCKFYAKLTENKSIQLIVKDKHDEEVFSEEIGNYLYFSANFTFEEK